VIVASGAGLVCACASGAPSSDASAISRDSDAARFDLEAAITFLLFRQVVRPDDVWGWVQAAYRTMRAARSRKCAAERRKRTVSDCGHSHSRKIALRRA
jgi:hypothetical protein